MKLIHLIISTALAFLSLVNAAQAQEVLYLDRSSFGKAVLSQTESTVGDIQLELSVGDYKNEPIINYSDRSELVQFGRSVGRLDVLYDKGISSCTAFIVSKQYILTNYHCSLGILENARINASRIDAINFVAGYTQTGIEENTRKYTVIPTPVEASKELDYAVLEVVGDPSQEYGELKLASLAPQSGDPFWIIGHPMGEGQRVSREKCRASSPPVSAGKLLHTCDTLPGNSGSPVIDVSLRQVVALHHAGSQKDSVNFAILMSEILENSTVLAAYKAPEEMPRQQPKIATNSACDALYSAAVQAKACYAYDAYINSCKDHSLAPIAKGYVNEFCQTKETVKVDKVPEKTCDDDPSLCSTDQLCGQSLTFKSGKAAWRTDNVNYVAEAKRRWLTCGVTEPVAQLEKACSEDAGVCREDQLCDVATNLNAGQKVWNTQVPRWMRHVLEAKKRDLSCGTGVVSRVIVKKYDDGAVYEGTFKNGLQDGIGTYRLPNGYEYTGTWVSGEILGQGEAHFPNGAVYQGSFANGEPHGNGRIVFADGGTYRGNFVEGIISGRGVSVYSNGTRYDGEFRDGMHNGSGIMTYLDGAIYAGTWIDNKKQGQAKVTYPDGALYVGEVSDGLRDGEGTLTYPDGVIYEGTWQAGEISGAGRLEQPNGDIYKGMLEEGLRQGKGVLVYANGNIYNGDFDQDQRHGQGEFTSKDGYKYTGSWSRGQIVGEGKAIYPDGTIYSGSFSADLPDGTGTITYPSGEVYKGQWSAGNIHGRGLATYPNGVTYMGEFRETQYHGKGIMTHSDGYRYDGDWQDGLRSGNGIATYPDGATYEGAFQNGKRQGKGQLTLPDGFTYNGDWQEGEMTGAGVATYSNGAVYSGLFSNGQRQGKGTMRYWNGAVTSGIWFEGKLQSETQ